MELAIARSTGPVLLLAYVPLALAVAIFAARFPEDFALLLENAFDPRAAKLDAAREQLLTYARNALPASAVLGAVQLWRGWRGKLGSGRREAGVAAILVAAPLLSVRMVEIQHPLLTGIAVLLFGVAAAALMPRSIRPALVTWIDANAERVGRWSLVLGYVGFVASVGFMAHWRFITFNAGAYDTSWETNAVHTIVHHGVPMTSVGAGSYYPGEHLPVNYAALHTPWIYYLYAPFYALFQDSRTLIWLQTLLMGAGAFGVYWFCRRRLGSPLLSAALGLCYLLYPHVQVSCMHDIHANILAIPLCLLGLGAMELGWHRRALGLAFLTCICREETAVYGVAMGLYWLTSRSSRRRVRYGGITLVMSLAVLLFITRFVMVKAGGTPRYSHFGLFFGEPGIPALLKSFLLNSWGALSVFLTSPRPEFVWLSLLPLGLLAVLGARRGLVFLLIPLGLSLPSLQGTFFTIGVNYSAPIVVPSIVLSILGARWWLAGRRRARYPIGSSRLALGSFVVTTALCCSFLYGNVFGRTYKLEFGGLPYRNSNQYEAGYLGVVDALPAYGPRERLLWQVIDKVPRGVPISTSGRINPQLSNRDVSMLYPEVGQGYPPDNRARYVVLDRLPSLYEAQEASEQKLRASGDYRVYFENSSGIILERIH